MNDLLQQSQAEALILSYKLDKIRNYIKGRIDNVDAITRNEFYAILNIIGEYVILPADWKLEKPLVDIIEETEQEDNLNV